MAFKAQIAGLVFCAVAILVLPTASAQDNPPDCTTGESFYPHATNCSLYWACSRNESILENCPPGLWWNASGEVCDWPTESGCTAQGTTTERPTTGTTSTGRTTTGTTSTGRTTTGMTSTGTTPQENIPDCTTGESFYPHATNCSLYWACSGDEAILENCPPGLWWNATGEVCDWPTESGCTAQGTTTERPTTETTPTGTTPTVTGTTPTGTTPEENIPDCTTGVEFYPHATNCSLYWACSGNESILENCPPGLWWNAAGDVCDWPTESGCTAQGTTTERPTTGTTSTGRTTTGTTSTGRTTTGMTSTGTTPQENIPDCTTGESFYPHATNCSLYWACSGDEAILENCPPGLWWNATGEVCDWPTESGCTAQGTTTERPTTETTPTGTTPTVTGTTPTGTTPEENIPDCTTGVEFYPHATNCSLYWACSGNESILENCPPGLWWNAAGDVCDWPTESGCTAQGTTTERPTTGTTPTGTTPSLPTEETTTVAPVETTVATEAPSDPDCPAVDDPNHRVRFQHPTRCDQYYLCVGGRKVLYGCTGDYHYSYSQDFCYPPELAGCDRCPIADIGHVVRLPVDRDCNLYYLCIKQEPVLYQCSFNGDYEFSRTKRDCIRTEEAQCSAKL